MTTSELKAAGNALFSAKQFVSAARKYSEAIRSVPDCHGVGSGSGSGSGNSSRELAVLYANRSACWLGIWRYIEACDDASKAIELDPTYAKAWARLATAKDALGSYSDSVTAWKQALDALPPEEETQQQRAQYQARYDAAAAHIQRLKNVVGEQVMMMDIVPGDGRMPWDLAARMIPCLRIQRPMNRTSSAWVIHYAYEDLMTGIRKTRHLFDDLVTNKKGGIPLAFEDISNGLLRDTRTMHLLNDEFMKQYEGQLQLEISSVRPWTPWPDAESEVVIQEALERQRSSGWDSVRRSLSLTIRVWLIQAFTEGALQSRPDVSLGYLNRALKTLRGLQEHWAQVARVERGVIFEPSFMFGLQKMHLEAMMQAYEPHLAEEILQEADLLISQVDATLRDDPPSDGLDPGFHSSFFAYPRATAFASRGFYYTKKAAHDAATCNGPYGKSWPSLRWAASEYMQAAGCLPPDDERYCVYLNLAIDTMLSSHLVPLRETLDAMERLRAAIPQAKAIWEHSHTSQSCLGPPGQGLWDTLEKVGERAERLRGMVESREVGLDACYGEGSA